MSEGKGQRKWPIPEGFKWSHNDDCYKHPDGRTWDPDTNEVSGSAQAVLAQAGGVPVDPKGGALTPAQPQQESVEQQIIRLQATAPRVTPADVQAAIRSVYFFRAIEGVAAADQGETLIAQDDVQPLGLTTFCAVVLRNGYTVYGKSACASPENYREEIGRRVAREDAESQIWPLLGFELCQMRHARKVAGIEEQQS